MERSFVERLAAARIGETFNQYADSAVRRDRLERYLEDRRQARLLLVAEAPGYRGTRISGIPLTSERQLTGHRALEPATDASGDRSGRAVSRRAL